MTELTGDYVERLIKAGVKNKTTKAYKAWEQANIKEKEYREGILKPYRETMDKAVAEFRVMANSLGEYPSLELHSLWEKYVSISHEEGNPVWGID